MNNFKDTLLQKIKSGEVAMQPKWHFVLRAVFLFVSLMLACLIAIYLLSFVFFTLHKSGLSFAPQYGPRGIMLFVQSSPWLLISVFGLFLFLLYVLVSRYSFSYRKPLVYSIAGIVFLVLLFASLIHGFAIHERVESWVEMHNVPGFKAFYRDPENRRPPGVVEGDIQELVSTGFIFVTDQGETLTVIVDPGTKMPPGAQLETGTEVLVFGNRTENTIHAFGIKLSEDGEFRLPRRKGGPRAPEWRPPQPVLQEGGE